MGELLLHVGHNSVLQLQTRGALFLQLPPLIVHFSLVATGFLGGKEIGERDGCRWKVLEESHWSCTPLWMNEARSHLCPLATLESLARVRSVSLRVRRQAL